MTERQQLEFAIAALHAQRALLGSDVVDAALGPMREQLARLMASTAVAAPEQVLKQVSVLFLDVVGSTALSQHLDPEDIHAVMDGALARCTEVVLAHGGKVLQYAGDNLLAAFGAALGQEDDAERAVGCGLALLAEGRALRERVRSVYGQDGCDVRVGVHTGPVLLGGGVDEEGTIRGLTVNIAARMEQTAPAGGLRISHDTWLVVRGAFEVDVQAPLLVKGRDEPLLTYLVQRAKPRAFKVVTPGIEGMATPLVGRDAELAQLVGMLDAAASDRKLHAATIIGEPGIGKSRLLHELQAALETHTQRFWLLLVRAHPQARLQPYSLLRDLLAWRLQISDSDNSEIAKTKLVDGLLPWLAGNGEAKAHRVGQLIGLDFTESPHVRGLEPPLLRSLAFAALLDYLQGLAAEGSALALLVEDLQWADDGSLDWLAQLMREGSGLPMALLATARPALLELRADWGASCAEHRTIRLAALDPAQRGALARALLDRIPEGGDSLRELLVERADGNPFFMEELVRMFIDDGVIVPFVAGERKQWRVAPDKLRLARVPTTLVGVLQARLDALTAADRLALQQASIVGYVFWDDALAALDPRALAAVSALQDKALIQRRDDSAFEGTTEETFHHHLLQQVTYDTVLKPARRAGHAAAAQWLAERIGDRPAEYLAITAEHYDRAGEHAKALDYFERAARDADRRFANQSALDHIARAFASPALTEPRHRERLLAFRENLADLMGLRALQEESLSAREIIAEALDDDALRADTLSCRALLLSRRGDDKTPFELASRALTLATRSGATDTAARAHGQLAWSVYCAGDLDTARGHAQASLALARANRLGQPGGAGAKDPHLIEVQTLTMLAIIDEAASRFAEARDRALEGLTLAQAHGLRRSQAHLLQLIGLLDTPFGRFRRALVSLEASADQSLVMGAASMAGTAEYNIALCHVGLGDADRALQRIRSAEATFVRIEHPDMHARSVLLRGIVAAQSGDVDGAQAAFDQALRDYERLDSPGWACQARARIADLQLAQGQLESALQGAERVAADIAGGLRLRDTEFVLFPALVCYRVWDAAGDARAAPQLERVHTELQDLAALAGDTAMRREMLQRVPLHREIVAAWRGSKPQRLSRNE